MRCLKILPVWITFLFIWIIIFFKSRHGSKMKGLYPHELLLDMKYAKGKVHV